MLLLSLINSVAAQIHIWMFLCLGSITKHLWSLLGDGVGAALPRGCDAESRYRERLGEKNAHRTCIFVLERNIDAHSRFGNLPKTLLACIWNVYMCCVCV